MWLMVGPGVISIVFGLVFMWAPQGLVRQQRQGTKRHWIEVDALFLQHRICTGISLIAVGVFCLLSAFYVWMRLHF